MKIEAGDPALRRNEHSRLDDSCYVGTLLYRDPGSRAAGNLRNPNYQDSTVMKYGIGLSADDHGSGRGAAEREG